MQGKLSQTIVKWSLLALKKSLKKKGLGLYELEEAAFNMFLPIQKALLEKISNDTETINTDETECPECQSTLKFKEVRKKKESLDLVRSL